MSAQAIILAAGRGERLRPLTDHTPKPLLQVGKHRLIEWHLLALARAGIREVVVNIAWLEEPFIEAIGDGRGYGLRVLWSREGSDHGQALETAGGIRKALPWLDEVFWVLSADVFVPEMVFSAQPQAHLGPPQAAACLWMVPNPPHHERGDFGMASAGGWLHDGEPRWTWGSVGVFRACVFERLTDGQPMRLRPLLDRALGERQLLGERLPGRWLDVGTEARLAEARAAAAGPAPELSP